MPSATNERKKKTVTTAEQVCTPPGTPVFLAVIHLATPIPSFEIAEHKCGPHRHRHHLDRLQPPLPRCIFGREPKGKTTFPAARERKMAGMQNAGTYWRTTGTNCGCHWITATAIMFLNPPWLYPHVYPLWYDSSFAR